jgi:D-alanyl-lipoteichoic acid acyltransferase DltB (MBOAT superfamily)
MLQLGGLTYVNLDGIHYERPDMNVTSLNFYFFLVVVLSIYYILPRRPQNYWLLLVSYAFYMTWAWQLSLILIVMTVINFFLALRMQKTEQSQLGLLWLGIGLNLAGLLLFRMFNFFLPGLYDVLNGVGIQLSEHTVELFIPIGLAYYSLQNISYLVDVHRRQISASSNFVDFALYLAYFPKLLSGPIERARTFLPKLARPRYVDNNLFARSLSLIVIGLIRKLFIAGTLSTILFWDAFETPTKYTGPELIGWIMIYGLFLYNDFGGYTSIARGVSGLFGIELSRNFQQPYFARNFTEFWNSWHISLSNWLRDYIYYPLSRLFRRRVSNPNNWSSLFFPPMATMIISGLWHGLNWHQVIERLSSLQKTTTPEQKSLWQQISGMVTVFILVTFAWVPFIMDLPVAFTYWGGMLDWTYPIIRFRRIFLFVPILVFVLGLDWLQRHYQDDEFFLRWPAWIQASFLAVSLFLILLLMQSGQEETFVYQGF